MLPVYIQPCVEVSEAYHLASDSEDQWWCTTSDSSKEGMCKGWGGVGQAGAVGTRSGQGQRGLRLLSVNFGSRCRLNSWRCQWDEVYKDDENFHEYDNYTENQISSQRC